MDSKIKKIKIYQIGTELQTIHGFHNTIIFYLGKYTEITDYTASIAGSA